MKPQYLFLPLILFMAMSCGKKKEPLLTIIPKKETRLTRIYKQSTRSSYITSTTTTLSYDQHGYLIEYSTIDSSFRNNTYSLGATVVTKFERDNDHKLIGISENKFGIYWYSSNLNYGANDLLSTIKFSDRVIEYTYGDKHIVQVFDTLSSFMTSKRSTRYRMTYDANNTFASMTLNNYESTAPGFDPEHAITYNGFSYSEQSNHMDVVSGIESYYPFFASEPQFLSKNNMIKYGISGHIPKTLDFNLRYDDLGYLKSKISADNSEHSYYTYKEFQFN